MVINSDPQPRDLRSFGIALPVFFAILGLILRARFDAPAVAITIWITGGVVTVLYAAVTRVRRPVFVGWLYLTYPIAWVITNSILVAIYLVVITPIGLLVRLFGRDPLERKFEVDTDTYWVAIERNTKLERYFQQY